MRKFSDTHCININKLRDTTSPARAPCLSGGTTAQHGRAARAGPRRNPAACTRASLLFAALKTGALLDCKGIDGTLRSNIKYLLLRGLPGKAKVFPGVPR